MPGVNKIAARLTAATGLPGVAILFLIAAWAVVTLPTVGPANYAKDGAFYTHMTLTWLGTPTVEASHQVEAWYAAQGNPVALGGDPADLPVWNLVAFRVFYSALSMPFVAALGIPGMLVIPALSILVMILMVASVAARRVGPAPAVGAALLILVSSNVQAFGFQNVTDPVVMGLAAVLMALMPWGQGRLSRGRVCWIAVAVLALCLTRQVGPVAAAVPVAGWAWSVGRSGWRNPWTVPAVVSTVVAGFVTVATLKLAPLTVADGAIMGIGYPSLGEAVVHLPETMVRTVWTLARDVARYDGALFVVAALAVVGMVRFWRSRATAMTLAAGLSALMVFSMNGSPTFRYYLLVVPFVGVSAAVGLGWLTSRERQFRQPRRTQRSGTDRQTSSSTESLVPTGSLSHGR